MKLVLLTAFNDAFQHIGSLCVASMQRYNAHYPDIRSMRWMIPDTFTKPASWAKVHCIRRLLETNEHEHVMWIDADALVVGQDDLRNLLTDKTLHIAKDLNGINCGVMAWRNCEQSITALKRIEDAYDHLSGHPWFEQAALMEFVDELEVEYVPKHLINAYADDYDPATTIIRHWPGQTNELRLAEMTEFAPKEELECSQF